MAKQDGKSRDAMYQVVWSRDAMYQVIWLEEVEKSDPAKYQDWLKQTVVLLNTEWHRSESARIHSLTSKQSMRIKNHLLLIETKADSVVGHTSIITEAEDEFYIESFIIDKHLRGHGLGRRLMNGTECFISNHLTCNENFSTKLIAIKLIARDENAEKFYSKLGFEVINTSNQSGSMNPCVKVNDVSTGENSIPPPPPLPGMQTFFGSRIHSKDVLMKKFIKKVHSHDS